MGCFQVNLEKKYLNKLVEKVKKTSGGKSVSLLKEKFAEISSVINHWLFLLMSQNIISGLKSEKTNVREGWEGKLTSMTDQ